MSQSHTNIATLGEAGLIERIRTIAEIRTGDPGLHDNLLIGISDDTAVYRPTAGKAQLFTTDAFVEGIHFDLTFVSPRHLGWKAIAANISDIAAMGGIPRYALTAISIPDKISVEMVEEFYRGATQACKEYSCLLVGGDTTTTLANMTVSVALTGEADEQRIVYRSGAKPGDLLCVTGHLGASHAGLKILQREKKRYWNSPESFRSNLEPYTTAIEKHLVPRPRTDFVHVLTDHAIRVNAMIDISDGLASEVHRIAAASGAGAGIWARNIPLDTVTQAIAAEFSDDPLDYSLYGGEEYELLFSIGDEEFARLEQLMSDVTIIGRMTKPEEGISLIRENGETTALNAGGWDHFRSR